MWNYGDIYEAVADVVPPDSPALIHRDRVISWADLDQRSNNIAKAMLDAGLDTGDKVGFYLRNNSAYMELMTACFKARLTHVNVNYRYVEDELKYILDNSDSKAVLFDAEFRDHVEHLRERLPNIRMWIQLGDEGNLIDGGVGYESLATTGDGKRLGISRSGEDMLFLYTGGTTGMPKGVMWEHQNHWLAGGNREVSSIEEHAEKVRTSDAPRRSFPVCPQMHGTGLFTSIGALAQGGSVVTTNSSHFDPHEVWQLVQDHGVNSMAIVGDAFGKPMLAALDENEGRYDLSSLRVIVSSGVMWSPEVKQGLIRHNKQLMLVDSFGASEAVGFGSSITTAETTHAVAKFMVGDRTKVFTEDHREVEPGSGEVGFIAKTGGIPSGYYKDPEKTARTFPEIDGVRYSIPGDWCQVEKDGTLTLLGRGSVCINTGGEKVFPEEVEEVLKLHDSIYDALVVGIPDDKWGQAVTAVVELREGVELDETDIRSHVREHLAAYKCPKSVLVIDTIGRASNGKADYKRITAFAKAELGIS